MLAQDKNQMLHWTPNTFLAKNTGAPFAMLRDYEEQGKLRRALQMGHYVKPQFAGIDGIDDCGCGCGGLGTCLDSPQLGYVSTVDIASNGDINLSDTTGGDFSYTDAGQNILSAVGSGGGTSWTLRPGAREADLIVPLQNQLLQQLGNITDQIRVGQSPNLDTLQYLLTTVKNLAGNFIQFVSSTQFVDGRASQQAMNTVMPYLDGTCGYKWPPPMQPTQNNCLSWGDGTIGGVGTNGMIGALQRAINLSGGLAPTTVTPITQTLTGGSVIGQPLGMGLGFGTNIPTMYLLIGAAALFLYSQRKKL